MAGFSSAERPRIPSPPSIEHLRAEGQRLRADFVRAQLEISMTIAGFGDVPRVTEELRQSSLRAAARGCKIVETLLPAASADEQQELRRKLEWLEARLLSPEPGAAPPAAWEPTRKEPQPAATNGNGTKGTGKLTRREVEVVKHIAEGNSTKRVAEILGITFKTAACHRYRIMDKLGIHETANLVRFAIRQGMVEP